jgi:hypothetical protein
MSIPDKWRKARRLADYADLKKDYTDYEPITRIKNKITQVEARGVEA